MTDLQMTDQQYVESIVKPLVDHPDDVVTTRTVDERGVLIMLNVNREDMGKVIGKAGKTVNGIRALLSVFGARNNSRIHLKVPDPEGEAGSAPVENEVMTSAPESNDGESAGTSVI